MTYEHSHQLRTLLTYKKKYFLLKEKDLFYINFTLDEWNKFVIW